mmetsp:Transcript_3871/g.13590  ORF Transcript_3871/g.13590 Transcript_3871/m.13590 type:complete len:245 (-) Transcript_3871:199-933(-)
MPGAGDAEPGACGCPRVRRGPRPLPRVASVQGLPHLRGRPDLRGGVVPSRELLVPRRQGGSLGNGGGVHPYHSMLGHLRPRPRPRGLRCGRRESPWLCTRRPGPRAGLPGEGPGLPAEAQPVQRGGPHLPSVPCAGDQRAWGGGRPRAERVRQDRRRLGLVPAVRARLQGLRGRAARGPPRGSLRCAPDGHHRPNPTVRRQPWGGRRLLVVGGRGEEGPQRGGPNDGGAGGDPRRLRRPRGALL